MDEKIAVTGEATILINWFNYLYRKYLQYNLHILVNF